MVILLGSCLFVEHNSETTLERYVKLEMVAITYNLTNHRTGEEFLHTM